MIIIRNIVLRILGLGYKNEYQAFIKIYNGNKLLIETKTYNGSTNLNIINGVYKVEIILNGITYIRYICVNDEEYIYDFILFNNYFKSNNRTDATGNEYGAIVTTDSNGAAVFNNVPYAESGAPTVYFKQLTSSDAHEFSNTVQSTTLTNSTETIEITNPLAASRTINLTDSNYTNLSIESGTITFQN